MNPSAWQLAIESSESSQLEVSTLRKASSQRQAKPSAPHRSSHSASTCAFDSLQLPQAQTSGNHPQAITTMADELLTQAQELFEGQIDFEGQKQTEQFTTIILSATGLVAFFLGFFLENIWTTLWIGLGGTALTFFMVVPPFPMYREAPEKWLPKGSGMVGGEISVG